MINLDNLWKQLSQESETTERKGILKRSILKEVGLSVGYDTVDNKKILLLEIEDPEMINDSDFPEWEGTELGKRQVGPEKYAIMLKLLDEENLSIYNALIKDLHSSIAQAETNLEAVTCFTNVFYKWYEFFKKFGTKALSEQAQRGIYGELYFIKKHLLDKSDAVNVLNSWQGHELKHHDFSFPNGVAEVKTTIRKAHKKVHIASEKQLDNTGLPNLYLYCITLNMDANNGQSLVEMGNSLSDFFDQYPNAAVLFNKFLSNTGYLTEHEEHYHENKYIFKNEYLFEVRDDFPRIIDPSEGVGDVKYTLMIGSCINYKVDIKSATENLF